MKTVDTGALPAHSTVAGGFAHRPGRAFRRAAPGNAAARVSS